MDQPNPGEIRKYPSGVGHPVDEGHPLDAARGERVGEDVLAALEKLCEHDYNGSNAVSAEVSNA